MTRGRAGRVLPLLATTALGLTLLLVATGTQPTRAGWSTAGLQHLGAATAAAAGSLAVTHTYDGRSCSVGARVAGTQTCVGRLGPAAAATAGGVTSTVQTRHDGTLPAGSVSASVGAPSCGPVRLDNARSSGNPMLPRHGTGFRAAGPFGGTNAISLDGVLAYASAVVQRTEDGGGLLTPGSTSGIGIWFATTSSQGGPLFEIAASPMDTAGADSRSLHLNPNGSLSFVQSSAGGASATTTTSTTGLNDGAWHFAYVTMNLGTAGVTTTTRIVVDGAQVGSTTGVLSGYSTDTGYWHLGWAPTSRTGLATAYLSGRLSNFVVFAAGAAPAAPTAPQRASQSAFTSWASGARDHWVLGDDGITTYGGPYPVLGSTSPCSLVDLTWTTTSPASQVGPLPLSAFADGSWRALSFPEPGQQQDATIRLARGAGYQGYVTGLRLHAPVRHRASAGGSWSVTLTWPDAAGVFLG